VLADAYVAVSPNTISTRTRGARGRRKEGQVCVCARARACASVRPNGTKRKRNKRIGRRALARELARACVRACERASRRARDGMHIRHRKFCDIETLL
jgi:hypothetical protein